MPAVHLDYTIPIWGVITLLIVPFVVWLVITMFDNKARIRSLETSHTEMQKAFSDVKNSLDSYKKDTNDKLGFITTTMTETKTLVKLLVDNKIKGTG